MSVTSYHVDTPNLTPHLPGRKSGPPLEELIARPQWVVWRLERRHNAPIDAKPTKVPYSPDGRRRASSTDATTWGTYADALTTVHAGRADGVGFVFSAGDPYFGIDLDGCRNPDTGEIEPGASEIIARFNTYAEPSPSGTGVHIIGRGVKPAPNSRKDTHIECYDRDRFFTMTLEPLPGYAQLRDCGETLTSWHREVWPQQAATPEKAAPITLTLEDRDIVDRLKREEGGSGKAVSLLAGDHGAYPSPSEARAALAFKCCFYTDSVDQVARIVQASGLFRDGTTEQERERKARQDATSAIENYTGPRYDPDRWHRQSHQLITPPPADRDDLEGKSADELRDIIRKQTAVIDAERAARVAAEQRAARAENIRSTIHSILRNKDLNAGARLTAFAIAMDLNARTANGEEPEHKQAYDKKLKTSYPVQAFKAPAARYADVTGHSPQTVAKHMRELADKGLLSKHLVRVERGRDDVDEETGEIITVAGKRDVNYIALPDNDVINLVERFATYQRPEGDTGQHGGTRTPRPACADHPTAGTFTVRHEHIECAECNAILQASEPKHTYHAPDDDDAESSHINLIPDNPSVVNVYSDIKLIPDKSDDGDTSPIKMVSDPECRHRELTDTGWKDCKNPTGGRFYCDEHANPQEATA